MDRCASHVESVTSLNTVFTELPWQMWVKTGLMRIEKEIQVKETDELIMAASDQFSWLMTMRMEIMRFDINICKSYMK